MNKAIIFDMGGVVFFFVKNEDYVPHVWSASLDGGYICLADYEENVHISLKILCKTIAKDKTQKK